MVRNLKLPSTADFFLDYTKDEAGRGGDIFSTRYELFVFGASYGRHHRLLLDYDLDKFITSTGKVKDPIQFSYFRTHGYEMPLMVILFSHFGGDIEKFKDEKECKKVLEAYAELGLEKFADDLKENHQHTSAIEIATFYTDTYL